MDSGVTIEVIESEDWTLVLTLVLEVFDLDLAWSSATVTH